MALVSEFLINYQEILYDAPKSMGCQCISTAVAREEQWITLPVERESETLRLGTLSTCASFAWWKS